MSTCVLPVSRVLMHVFAASSRQDAAGLMWIPLVEPAYWLRRCTGNTARYDERCAEIHSALRQAIGVEARAPIARLSGMSARSLGCAAHDSARRSFDVCGNR